MGVITNVSDYSNRCLELEKNDDIVRPDFNAHEMNYEVEMYSLDGEFLGSTKDDLVFIDWKARIARKGVHGYYIKVNDKTVTLDKNATPNMEVDGMFDAYVFSLLELV